MLPWAVAEQYWECYQSSRCLCCISTTAHQSFLAQQQKKTGRCLYSHIKRMAAGHVELPYVSPALHAILQAQPHPWKPQMASSSWFKSHLGCCFCWPGCLTDYGDGRGFCAFKATFDLGPFLQRTHSMDGCPWCLLTAHIRLIPTQPQAGASCGATETPWYQSQRLGMQATKMLWFLFVHCFLQMETGIERLTSLSNAHACHIGLLGISLSFCAWFTNGGKMVWPPFSCATSHPGIAFAAHVWAASIYFPLSSLHFQLSQILNSSCLE